MFSEGKVVLYFVAPMNVLNKAISTTIHN